jgi:tetratricopeptide (TPR) repeat protein
MKRPFGAWSVPMRVGAGKLCVAFAGLLWLSGCVATNPNSQFNGEQPEPVGSVPGGSLPAPGTDQGLGQAVLGNDPNDDLSLGKRHYKEQNYGLAEKHFRKAVEMQPRTAEAWVGLAASYDRLRRFDLADRAYTQAINVLGPTPEILNNQGYSYMLRGDYKMARKKLVAAQAKDPNNPYILNNIELLEEVTRKGKGLKG